MVAIIVLSATVFILAEAIGFLAYKTYRLHKQVKEVTKNLNSIAECVLHMAKGSPTIDVVEKAPNSSVDFIFPNSEGF